MKEADVIIDYASPLIQIEALVRAIHEECLKRDYVAAHALATHLMVESRLLSHTLVDMRVQQVRLEGSHNVSENPVLS